MTPLIDRGGGRPRTHKLFYPPRVLHTQVSPRLDLLQSAAAMSFPQDRGEKKIYKYTFVSKKRILFVSGTGVDGRTGPRVS